MLDNLYISSNVVLNSVNDEAPTLTIKDSESNDYTFKAENGKLIINSDVQFAFGEPPTITSISSFINSPPIPDYRIIYPTGEWKECNINSTPFPRTWYASCYGNDKYVAITNNSSDYVAAYSSDGKAWTKTTIGNAARTWMSVAYGTDKFVAIRNDNYYGYSTDGITWITGQMKDKDGNVLNNGYSNKYTSVCYAENMFVAVANGSKGSTISNDGLVWRLLPNANDTDPVRDFRDVCYGNGMFVAALNNSGQCKILRRDSNDEFTAWEEMPVSGTSKKNWRSVCYGRNRFVMVANPRMAAILEDDSEEWTLINISIDNREWFSVTYGAGVFVAFENTTNGSNVAAYSVYGDTWTLISLPITAKWHHVTYGANGFVAVAENSAFSIHSDDGISWYTYQIPSEDFTNRNWTTCCAGGDQFVLVATQSNVVAHSLDGINWIESVITDDNVNRDWSSVAFGKGRFVAVTRDTNQIAFSFNIVNWTLKPLLTPPLSYTPKWNCICYGRDRFVAIQGDTDNNNRYVSNKAAYSMDGINWIETNLACDGIWTSVCYGNGLFVCIGFGSDGASESNPGNLYEMVNYSSDGITWSYSGVSGLNNRHWYGICYNIDKYVILANDSIYGAYSSDGKTWTEVQISNSKHFWRSVCYGNGRFVAIANRTQIVSYSIDGVLWNELTINGKDLIRNCVCYGNGRFVMPIGGDHIGYYVDMRNNYTQQLDSLSQLILQRIYPVGAIYVSAENINPKTLFGFGDWQRISGKFLFTNDTGSGTIGGELTHQITVNELPSHSHEINIQESTFSTSGTDTTMNYINSDTSNSMTSSTTGGNQPMSIMPVYYTVYAWRRIW